MFHGLDDYQQLAIYKYERQVKMRFADEYRRMKEAGINPYRISWERMLETIRYYIQRLSFFEKTSNPCLDCPPAGV